MIFRTRLSRLTEKDRSLRDIFEFCLDQKLIRSFRNIHGTPYPF